MRSLDFSLQANQSTVWNFIDETHLRSKSLHLISFLSRRKKWDVVECKYFYSLPLYHGNVIAQTSLFYRSCITFIEIRTMSQMFLLRRYTNRHKRVNCFRSIKWVWKCLKRNIWVQFETLRRRMRLCEILESFLRRNIGEAGDFI